MLRSLFGIPLLCAMLAIEFAIAVVLVGGTEQLAQLSAPGLNLVGLQQSALNLSTGTLLVVHVVASLIAALCIAVLLNKLIPGRRTLLTALLFLTSVFIPFLGAAGCWLSMTFGAIMAQHRHKENVFWQFTDNADLPFAAPVGRALPKLDSRGFIEQLTFDDNAEKLYNKVVASRHIRDSQSGPILKAAVTNKNERIRLVAYQMLDKKVSSLNKEIQRLEAEARRSSGIAKSNIHLQITNIYWELLTLEGDEPVAREQLLLKAEGHATEAVQLQPGNVNAHFLLGQIALKQGATGMATTAFENAQKHGMSKDKVIPYIAEAAYEERNFTKLRNVLRELDPAFRSYPPFSNVVEFWA